MEEHIILRRKLFKNLLLKIKVLVLLILVLTILDDKPLLKDAYLRRAEAQTLRSSNQLTVSKSEQLTCSDLQKYGPVNCSWLGIGLGPISPQIAESLGLDEARGAKVIQIVSNGPVAKNSAIQPGDVILEFDGWIIWNADVLPLIVEKTAIGKKVDVVLQRTNKTIKTEAEIGELPLDNAMARLGWMFLTGNGVPQNDAEAAKWLRKAAEQGNAYAQYSLGWMYENGRGVPKENLEALKWYRIAAKQGYKEAQQRLDALEH